MSEPFRPNTWLRNLNNDNYQISDTNRYHIDGSWLDNGDYDRAFKGIPSKKEVNIFLGAGYQQPSWKESLVTGGLSLGFTGLAMWGMSKLFGRRGNAVAGNQGATAQSSYFQNYFNNVANFFNVSAASTPVNGNNGAQGAQGTQGAQGSQGAGGAQGAQGAQGSQGAGGAQGVGDAGGTKVSRATAINTAINTEGISGQISDIKPNNENGYPASFKVTDESHGKGDKASVYTFTFVEMNGEKPKYIVKPIELATENDKSADINYNKYTINQGITKGKQGETATISSNVQMSTDSNVATVHNTGDLGKGSRRQYPQT